MAFLDLRPVHWEGEWPVHWEGEWPVHWEGEWPVHCRSKRSPVASVSATEERSTAVMK